MQIGCHKPWSKISLTVKYFLLLSLEKFSFFLSPSPVNICSFAFAQLVPLIKYETERLQDERTVDREGLVLVRDKTWNSFNMSDF